MPSRTAIGCCSNIPDLKKHILYNLLAIMGQWYNKDVNYGLILSNRDKQSESVRTIEELTGIISADFQTLFSKYSA